MLDLDDFVHLPDLDGVVARIIDSGPGLIVVAGMDPHFPSPADPMLPSGRSTVFRILVRRFLQREATGRAYILTRDRETVRVSRHDRKRVEIIAEPTAAALALRIQQAATRLPSLLVLDALDRETAGPALQAARLVPVLAQLEVGVRSADIERALAELGASRAVLGNLHWAIAVQRVPALCQACARHVEPDELQLAALRRRLGSDAALPEFRSAAGCPVCEQTGRYGEVLLFDIYDYRAGEPVLSQERYAVGLAAAGYLSLDDVLGLETAQLRRAYQMMATNESALRQVNAELQRRLLELESAHRVLVQRTEALNALQRVGEVLLADMEPQTLAEHICRQARDISGADRAVLYRFGPDGAVEVLATAGWDAARFALPVEPDSILQDGEPGNQAVKFEGAPPGIAWRTADVEGAVLRSGLRVPLVAQGMAVGALFVHSTVRPKFEPGQVALLQTVAAQAAVALQRAGLTAELRAKVAALEAAQRELVIKERMERELELAREVQQSFLPRDFPKMPPYIFAAENEPARQVGGDFYDVFDLGSRRAGIVIADVSDKGLPAALYMALTRSLIRAEARRVDSPREVLVNVNRLLLELGEPGMFVTVCYAVLDVAANRLTYTRAGHDEPLLLRRGAVCELSAPGMLLGVFEDAGERATEETLELEPGDLLVFYTDGLTDVRDPSGEILGQSGLRQILLAHAGDPPSTMCQAIFADLRSYLDGMDQGDDMTLLILADGR